MTLAELVDEYLQVHQAALATMEKLRWLLAKSTAAFGEMALVDLRADEICAWRGALPGGHRFEATQALRQVLNAAVAWQLLDLNPAGRGVANPLRRFRRSVRSSHGTKSERSLRSWPVTGLMVVFGATGLRPAELVALSRATSTATAGSFTCAATRARPDQAHQARRSVRAVPLQAAALEALHQLPESDDPALFPAARGGYIDLHDFRARRWRPAQLAAGIEPIRRPYDLRHPTRPSRSRAGVSIIDLSRFMGASLAIIDKHYGHMARDGREHAVALLDPCTRDRRLDAKWTSAAPAESRTATANTRSVSQIRSGGRFVDVAVPKRRLIRQRTHRLCRCVAKAR